jgi:hypothetical protein
MQDVLNKRAELPIEGGLAFLLDDIWFWQVNTKFFSNS